MEYNIRRANYTDIDQLQVLFSELSGHGTTTIDIEDRLQMVENSAIDEIYVYEHQGLIHGFLAFRIRENIEEPSRYGEISALVVHPQSRKLGIGHALMEFAENHARELGCKGTWLVSGFGREEEAHQFYASLGYKITGYRFVKIT